MLLIHGGITPEGIVLSRFPASAKPTKAHDWNEGKPTTEISVLGDEEFLL
jgi:hypothetical protein